MIKVKHKSAKEVMDKILEWYQDDGAWGDAACDLFEDVIVPFLEECDSTQKGRLEDWQASMRAEI